MLFVHLLLHLMTLRQSADFLEQVEAQFENFIQVHNRTYARGGPGNGQVDLAEYGRRMAIFSRSLETIDRLNSLRTHEESARFGVTQFADMTTEEFLATGKNCLMMMTPFNIFIIKQWQRTNAVQRRLKDETVFPDTVHFCG